jgi:hypothetical protein
MAVHIAVGVEVRSMLVARKTMGSETEKLDASTTARTAGSRGRRFQAH